jgi:hypothetical protein
MSQKLELFITTTVRISDPIIVVVENFRLMGVRWVNFCVYLGLCVEKRSWRSWCLVWAKKDSGL